MNISEVNDISDALKKHLEDNGLTGKGMFGAIYTNNDVPTTDLPESFLSIVGNGPLSSKFSLLGIMDFYLMLNINVALSGNGGTNSIREGYLMQQLNDVIGERLTIGQYHYHLDKRNMVYSGKSLRFGYSNKIINLLVKIY